METRQTLFSDVCGTMDELKRLHHEEYQRILKHPASLLDPLLRDAEFMLGSMGDRLERYDRFRADVRSLLERSQQFEPISTQQADDALDFLGQLVAASDGYEGADVEAINEAAEDIRAVATEQEHRLRAHKELALKLYDMFLDVKGGRPWILADHETGSYKEGLRKQYQSWLPPEPHGTMLLDRLAESGAVVVDGPRSDGEPDIKFEDGGSIAMSQVRWDPNVRNFHPANFTPGAGGRDYRRTTPERAAI